MRHFCTDSRAPGQPAAGGIIQWSSMRARLIAAGCLMLGLAARSVTAAGTAAERAVDTDVARWRPVKVSALASFHPPPASISSSARAVLLTKQFAHASPAPGPPDRTTIPVAAPDLFGATNAIHDAWARPVVRREAFVEAVVDAHGELQSITVETPSGDGRFDDAALDALRGALALHPMPDSGSRVIRWRVTATRAVQPPRIHTAIPLKTRPTGLVPQMAFKFDETKAGIKPQVPFSDEVKTEIELVSVVAVVVPDGGS